MMTQNPKFSYSKNDLNVIHNKICKTKFTKCIKVREILYINTFFDIKIIDN